MFPRNFSLAVAGKGKLLLPFVRRVYEHFPGIVLYDRNAEAKLDSSDKEHPYIPQVAYVDVLFSHSGAKEMATIRCFHRHRFFNYDMNETEPGSKREALLMNSMLKAIEDLCELPRLNVPEIPVTPELASEAQPGTESGQDNDLETSTPQEAD